MLEVTQVGGVNMAGPQLGSQYVGVPICWESQIVGGHNILLSVVTQGVTLVMSAFSCQNMGSQKKPMPKCGGHTYV